MPEVLGKTTALQYRFDSGPSGKAHIHLLGDKPLVGTSGVCKIVKNIPPWWASGLAVKVLGIPEPKLLTKIKKGQATVQEREELLQAVTVMHSRVKSMQPVEYLELLDLAYRAHQASLAESADAGTDLHAELERFVKDQIEGIEFPQRKYHSRIEPFISWYTENVETPLWSEVHCFSEEHWLGGISDFGFIDKKGMLGIMDFKSSKAAYPEQFWQCAGYDLQLSENGGYNPTGTKILTLPKAVDYYSVLPFGMEKPVPQINYDVATCKSMFLHCLALYQNLPRD